jgi:hypothetical protein
VAPNAATIAMAEAAVKVLDFFMISSFVIGTASIRVV